MSWNVENLFDVGAEDGPETETELKAKLESLRSVIDEQRPHVLGSESALGKLQAELKTPMQHKSVADATSAGSASRISAGGCCATRSRSGLSQAGCSESTPLELPSRSPRSPSAVRPALALTAPEGSRRSAASYFEAATSTSRETGGDMHPSRMRQESFQQEISVPDHGARIKAVETLLREGLGRVGEAELVEPKVPQSVEELRNLSTAELELIVALGYATQIRAVVDDGDDALRLQVERWEYRAIGHPSPRRVTPCDAVTVRGRKGTLCPPKEDTLARRKLLSPAGTRKCAGCGDTQLRRPASVPVH